MTPESQDSVPQSLSRLRNPIPADDDKSSERFYCPYIAKSEYDYLIRGVLCGVHGSSSAIIGQVIFKLNTKLRELGIPNHYHPDNESIVANLLAGITFAELPGGEHNPGNGTSPVAHDPGGVVGSTNSEPDRDTSPRTESGTTPRIRRGKSDKKGKRTDTKGRTRSGK